MKVTIFTVAQEGVGKPDYTREISSGETRPGLKLKYLQNLKFFALMPSHEASSIVWRVDPVAPGATVHMIDGETGLSMPFTVPVGYTLDIFDFTVKPTEDVYAYIHLDGERFVDLCIVKAGYSHFQAEMVEKGTSFIDPTGASSHQFDILIDNLGAGNLEMGACFFCFLTAVGTTPLPTTKEVKCKYCGNLTIVPYNTSRVICPKCGKLTTYLDLSKYRGGP